MRLLVPIATFLLTMSSVVAQPTSTTTARYSEVHVTLGARSDLARLAERVPELGHVEVTKSNGG